MSAGDMSQGIEQNKRIVREFFALASRAGFTAALESLPESLQWRSIAGPLSRPQMLAMAQALTELLAEPFVFEIDTVTAEEDRVAVEARGRGLRKNGVRYANTYHFLIRVKDGRIVEVHEHCDTAHAAAVWSDLFQPAPSGPPNDL